MRNISIDTKGKKPKLQGFITDATNIDDESESGRINITDKDLVSNSLSFTSSTSNSGEITIGAAIIGGCNFTLWNDNGKFDNYNWTNTVVSISLVYDDSVSVYMGYFYIVSHRESGDTIRVEALDAFKIMDIHQLYEVGITWPSPASTVLSQIANFSFTRGVIIEGIDDISDIMLYDPQIDQMPLREAVSYIAQLCGKFATIRSLSTVDLILHFGWYDTANSYSVGTTFSHDLRTDNVTVSGISITDTSDELTTLGDSTGYVIEITDNPFISPYNVDSVAERLSNVIGLSFRPGSFTVENNAAIEAGDAIQINTRDEQNINTLATTMTFKPFQLQESITADCESEAGDIQISLANYIRKVAREEAEKASGGGGGEGGMTPEDVYKRYRPADWVTLPQVGTNEAYFLLLIPVGSSETITSRVYAPNSSRYINYTRDIGYMQDGSFVQVEHDIVTTAAVFSKKINADDYDSVTTDGFAQVVVHIHTIAEDPGEIFVSGGYKAEARVNAPTLTYGFGACLFVVSDSAVTSSSCRGSNTLVILDSKTLNNESSARSSMSSLISDYITENTSESFSCSGKYNNCSALVYAGIDNKNANASLDVSSMFYGCTSLIQPTRCNINCETLRANDMFYNAGIVKFDGVTVTGSASIYRMFRGCTNLRFAGEINVGSTTDCTYLFYSCSHLYSASVGTITSAMNYMFYQCPELTRVKLKLGAGAVIATTTFTSCNALRYIDLEVDGWTGSNIQISSCPLSREAAVALFEALPQAGASYTITLSTTTKNAITEEDRAIATNKGYAIA